MITGNAKATIARRHHHLLSSRTERWPGPALLLGMMMLAEPRRMTAKVITPSRDNLAIGDLVAKATRRGTLRVIVDLKIDPLGPPSRDGIARLQDQVLQELAGTDHRVLRRSTTAPFMGMETPADALRHLAASTHVVGVREDMVLRPQ
jgi:hypothetical protein